MKQNISEEKEKILGEATVVYQIRNTERGREILMGWKTEKICKDFWVGSGGGIERGETMRQCAARENEEEFGVKVYLKDLQKIAIVYCHNTKDDGTKYTAPVHFFVTERWFGEPKESKTIVNLTWFPVDALPYMEMPPTDRDWHEPVFKEGKKVIAQVYLRAKQRIKDGETTVEYVDVFDDD